MSHVFSEKPIQNIRSVLTSVPPEYFSRVFNGNNVFPCICSAIDWLSVAIENIDFYPSFPLVGADHESAIQHALLLMRVSWIKEAIDQLNRIMNKTTKTYLVDDRSVFANATLDDNDYFQELRAMFAAHQTNLSPVLYNNKSNEKGFFASWPFGTYDGLAVFIYSKKQNAPIDKIVFPYKKIEEFAFMRYSYLTEVEQIIRREGAVEKQPLLFS